MAAGAGSDEGGGGGGVGRVLADVVGGVKGVVDDEQGDARERTAVHDLRHSRSRAPTTITGKSYLRSADVMHVRLGTRAFPRKACQFWARRLPRAEASGSRFAESNAAKDVAKISSEMSHSTRRVDKRADKNLVSADRT